MPVPHQSTTGETPVPHQKTAGETPVSYGSTAGEMPVPHQNAAGEMPVPHQDTASVPAPTARPLHVAGPGAAVVSPGDRHKVRVYLQRVGGGGTSAASAAAGSRPAPLEIGELVYAGNRRSRCFAQRFLDDINASTALAVSPRLKPVLLESPELFTCPLVVMSGEGSFALSAGEQANLGAFLAAGGTIIASAGCSDAQWDAALRAALRTVVPHAELQAVDDGHPLLWVLYDVRRRPAIAFGGGPFRSAGPLEMLTLDGRPAVIYSPDGLNDSRYADDCCCCEGSESANAAAVLVNAVVYAVTH
jgi:hypothetical protein